MNLLATLNKREPAASLNSWVFVLSPVTIPLRILFPLLASIGVLALGLGQLPDLDNPILSALKLLAATFSIWLLPGISLFAVIRPRQDCSLFELIAIGIGGTLALAQIYPIVSIQFHIGLSVLAKAVCLLGVLALFFGTFKAAEGNLILRKEEIPLMVLILPICFFLYLKGMPRFQEDFIHLAILRRLAYLAHPDFGNVYYAAEGHFTHPFPGIHALIGMTSRLGNLDPLFVYEKLRFFWVVPSLALLYCTASMIFKSHLMAFVSALAAIFFIANGTFTDVERLFWAQLAPYSHPSDLALAIVLPSAIVMHLYFLNASTKRENIYFFCATFGIILLLVFSHAREAIQMMVYLSAFSLALYFLQKDKSSALKCLLIVLLTGIAIYTYARWYQHVVAHTRLENALRKSELTAKLHALSWQDLFLGYPLLEPNYYLMAFPFLFYGWNAFVLFLSPLVFFAYYRKSPLVLFASASIFAYLLIVRFAFIAIPFILATYHEILFLPVRNLIFFLHFTTGVVIYLLAIQFSKIRSSAIALGSLLTTVLFISFVWKYGTPLFNKKPPLIFEPKNLDIFFIPILAAYLFVFLSLGKSSFDRWRVALAPDKRPSKWASYYVLLLSLLSLGTLHFSSSPLSFSKISTTSDALLRDLQPEERNFWYRPDDYTGNIVTPKNALGYAPSKQLIQWLNENITYNAVFACNTLNPYPLSVFVPHRITAWPSVESNSLLFDKMFPKYYARMEWSIRKYGVQPFFNNRETLDERLQYIQTLGITHILIDPMYREELMPILDKQGKIFQRLYDDGRWAVYQISAKI